MSNSLSINPLYLDSYHPNEEEPTITDIDCKPRPHAELDEMLDMSTSTNYEFTHLFLRRSLQQLHVLQRIFRGFVFWDYFFPWLEGNVSPEPLAFYWLNI